MVDGPTRPYLSNLGARVSALPSQGISLSSNRAKTRILLPRLSKESLGIQFGKSTRRPNILHKLTLLQADQQHFETFGEKIVGLSHARLAGVSDITQVNHYNLKRYQAMDPRNPTPWWQVRSKGSRHSLLAFCSLSAVVFAS